MRRDEEAKKKLPRMSWMNVDLHQLAQQKASNAVALPGQPGQRALRRADSSAPSKKSNRWVTLPPTAVIVHAISARTMLWLLSESSRQVHLTVLSTDVFVHAMRAKSLLLVLREMQTTAHL